MAVSLIPQMTGNTTPAPYVASASDFYTGQQPFKAFNKTTGADQGWRVFFDGPEWLKIDLGAVYTADLYKITAEENYRAPNSWTLQGSADGAAWTTLDTQPSVAFTDLETKSFTLAQPATYRFFRLHVTATGSTYLTVGEWDLLGTPPTPTGAVAGTLGSLAGSFVGSYVPPPVTGELAGSLGNLGGVFEGRDPNLPNPAQLAGTLGFLSGSFAGDFQMVVASSTTYANYGYGYAGVGTVDYTPPIAATPARVRRVKVQRVHQSLPAPTLENGRPT